MDEPLRSVYLVNHGWHAGLVVRRDDIPEGVWPQADDFADAEYLEVGWGDRDYYMDPDAGVGSLLKAALWPTSSVLQVVGFDGPVERFFPVAEIVRVELSVPGFRGLCEHLGDAYAIDESGQSLPLGPALYGDGRFYLARETYHLFNTCNAWTARALRSAGCPIRPGGNLMVDTLMKNAAAFGTVIRAAPEDAD